MVATMVDTTAIQRAFDKAGVSFPPLIRRAFAEGGGCRLNEEDNTLHSIEGRGWHAINGESKWYLVVDGSRKNAAGDVLDLSLGVLLLNQGKQVE
jgi:hypothetical protein